MEGVTKTMVDDGKRFRRTSLLARVQLPFRSNLSAVYLSVVYLPLKGYLLWIDRSLLLVDTKVHSKP